MVTRLSISGTLSGTLLLVFLFAVAARMNGTATGRPLAYRQIFRFETTYANARLAMITTYLNLKYSS
jgi:hypothetical protein